MDDWRKTVLDDESVETYFCYYNAHLLFSLYAAADKAITEKERGLISKHDPLGRDCLPKVINFSSSAESASISYSSTH